MDPIQFIQTAGVIIDYKKHSRKAYNTDPLVNCLEEDGFYMKEIELNESKTTIEAIKQINNLDKFDIVL